MVEFEEGGIQVDVAIVAKGLGIERPLLLKAMREGRITSLCERRLDDDDGRYRLTFFSENRRFRLLVDDQGNVIHRAAIDFGDRGLPASARKPGA
jgi:hypothetical protein